MMRIFKAINNLFFKKRTKDNTLQLLQFKKKKSFLKIINLCKIPCEKLF